MLFKEEELRKGLDPKFSHLSDDLHIEISALAPPAEAHARIAYALAEIRKFLIPDSNDDISMEQLREMENYMEPPPGGVEEEPPQKRPMVRPVRGMFRGWSNLELTFNVFMTGSNCKVIFSFLRRTIKSRGYYAGTSRNILKQTSQIRRTILPQFLFKVCLS